jgi:hypothetical protein
VFIFQCKWRGLSLLIVSLLSLSVLTLSFPRDTLGQLTHTESTKIFDSSKIGFERFLAVTGNTTYVLHTERVIESGGHYDVFLTKVSNIPLRVQDSSTNLSNNPGASFASQILQAENGKYVYALWADDTSGSEDVYFRRSADHGMTFDEPLNLSNNSVFSGLAQMAISGNYVYVVWWELSPAGSDIAFARSTDYGESFSEAVLLSDEDVGDLSALSGSRPLLQIQASEKYVYVTWHASNSSNIFFQRSDDYGALFDLPSALTRGKGQALAYQLSAKGSDVFVVWDTKAHPSGDSEIYIRKSGDYGVSFCEGVRLSDDNGSLNPIMATSDSNVYVVWESYVSSSGDRNVFFARSIDGGSNFEPPLKIEDSDLDSHAPAIAAVQNYVSLAWRSYNDDSEKFRSDINFMTSEDSGHSFGKRIRVNDSQESQNHVLGLSESGRLALVWEDLVDSSPQAGVYFLTAQLDIVPMNEDSADNQIGSVSLSPLEVRNLTSGKIQNEVTIQEPVALHTVLVNNRATLQPYVLIIEVRNEHGITTFLQYQSGVLSFGDRFDAGFSWIPGEKGRHEIRTIAITSLQNPSVISSLLITRVKIA